MTPEPPAGDQDRRLREELILELARARPGFRRELAGADLRESERSSPTCGDRIRIRADVRDDVVAGVGWDGRGCAVSTASAGVLSALAPGIPIDRVPALVGRVRQVVGTGSAAPSEDAGDVGDMRLFAGIGRLPLRGRCAMLPWEALAEAVQPAPALPDQAGKCRAS